MAMRAMLFRVVNPNARLGMLIAVNKNAAEEGGGPGAVMGLEA
jgi:hypothetical protein